MEANSMYFNDKRQAIRMVSLLLATTDDDLYCDIHIYSEDSGYVLEWVQVPFSRSWGGKFEYVNEDEQVMYRGYFPDGHWEYFENEEEFKEAYREFLADNKEYATSEGAYNGV